MKYTISKIHIYRCLPPYRKWYSITTDSGITKDNIVIVGKKRLLKVAFALMRDENIEPRIMSGNFSNKHLLLDEHLNDILKMNENQHYCKTNPNKL